MRFCGLFYSEKRCRFGAGLMSAIRRGVTAAFRSLGALLAVEAFFERCALALRCFAVLEKATAP